MPAAAVLFNTLGLIQPGQGVPGQAPNGLPVYGFGLALVHYAAHGEASILRAALGTASVKRGAQGEAGVGGN